MTDLVAASAVIADLYRNLGAHLAAARKRQHVTAAMLGAAVGLSRASITNIETGNQRIQVHTLIAAAQCLGIDPADLISQAVEGQPPIAAPLPPGKPLDGEQLTRQLRAAKEQINAALKHLTRETT